MRVRAMRERAMRVERAYTAREADPSPAVPASPAQSALLRQLARRAPQRSGVADRSGQHLLTLRRNGVRAHRSSFTVGLRVGSGREKLSRISDWADLLRRP